LLLLLLAVVISAQLLMMMERGETTGGRLQDLGTGGNAYNLLGAGFLLGGGIGAVVGSLFDAPGLGAGAGASAGFLSWLVAVIWASRKPQPPARHREEQSPGTKLEAFIVDGAGRDRADLVRSCRLVLQTVEADASQYETDIPADSDEWPAEVVAAAKVLREVAARTGRVEGDNLYAQTGIVEAASDAVWSAFVTFAPWAYDATVWNLAGDDIVSLADEGHSILVRLTPDQYAAIAAELTLVPYREWKAVSKRRRANPA
jgi:hypothetical protein